MLETSTPRLLIGVPPLFIISGAPPHPLNPCDRGCYTPTPTKDRSPFTIMELPLHKGSKGLWPLVWDVGTEGPHIYILLPSPLGEGRVGLSGGFIILSTPCPPPWGGAPKKSKPIKGSRGTSAPRFTNDQYLNLMKGASASINLTS